MRENVAYLANETVTDADMALCVKHFRLGPVIHRLGGLDAMIRAGDQHLSTSERAQVVLARAYLSGADLVILDETTCHVDAEEERSFEHVLRAGGRTLIVIAHRLDVTARADQVLYLDGVTAEVGSQVELLERCQPYRDLNDYDPRKVALSG
jgi:ATP-binding cassette subfamily C protein